MSVYLKMSFCQIRKRAEDVGEIQHFSRGCSMAWHRDEPREFIKSLIDKTANFLKKLNGELTAFL